MRIRNLRGNGVQCGVCSYCISEFTQLYEYTPLGVNLFVCYLNMLIGASLNEPHINGTALRQLFVLFVTFRIYAIL